MPLYLALKTRIVLIAPIWTMPRTMNTDAGSKTAWIVIRIEATNQKVNALRLIPAEHFWLIKCEICGRYAYPASDAPLRPISSLICSSSAPYTS
jgi:hypothetical protein